jgi:hypothetical protein
MLVLADHERIALFLGNRDRRDFGVEVTRFLRGDGLELAGERHLPNQAAIGRPTNFSSSACPSPATLSISFKPCGVHSSVAKSV